MIGLLIDIVLVIHPMWVMEEYAISDLNFDWFIPIIPPASALVEAKIMISSEGLFM